MSLNITNRLTCQWWCSQRPTSWWCRDESQEDWSWQWRIPCSSSLCWRCSASPPPHQPRQWTNTDDSPSHQSDPAPSCAWTWLLTNQKSVLRLINQLEAMSTWNAHSLHIKRVVGQQSCESWVLGSVEIKHWSQWLLHHQVTRDDQNIWTNQLISNQPAT